MSSTPSITLHPYPPADYLDLGTFASAFDLSSVTVAVHNDSSQHQNVYFSLSTDLDSLLSVHSAIRLLSPPSTVANGPYFVDANLLYVHSDSLNCVSVPSRSSLLVRLLISASPTSPSPIEHHKCSSEHLPASNPAKEYTGQLLVRSSLSKTFLCSLQVLAKIGESIVKPDKDWLDVGRCSLSVWAYSELSIQNLTDIPTHFSISSDFPTLESSEETCMCFLDRDSAQVLDKTRIPVNPNASVCIKVGIRPVTIGTEERCFSVQNLRNPLDVWYIYVTVKGIAENVAERLHVSCGSELDFGDCYAHFQTCRDISLQNDYAETISVELLSDQKQQISYQVLQDHADLDVLASHTQQTLDPHLVNVGDISHAPNPPVISGEEQPEFIPASYDTHEESIDTRSELTLTARKQFTDHVSLWSGQRKKVRIWYTSLPSSSWEHVPETRHTTRQSSRHSTRSDVTKLRAQRFQMVFRLPSGESRTVTGRARVCESIVRLERSEVHMGDCDVLVHYKTKATIINCSDLPAYLRVSYVSKCVCASVHDIIIPPKDTFDLVLHFVPRQVNRGYRKVISFRNLRNPNTTDVAFTLRANCIDKQGVTLHALFYKILAPGSTNEIDFGDTVVNHPAINTFRIRNESNAQLVLKFGCSPGVSTYASPSALTRATWVAQRLLGHNSVRGLPLFDEKVKPRFDDGYLDGDSIKNGGNYRLATSLLDPGTGQGYLPSRCIPAHDKIDVRGRTRSWGRESGHNECAGEWENPCLTGAKGDYVETNQNDPGENSDSEFFQDDEDCLALLTSFQNRSMGLVDSMHTFPNPDSELRFTEQQLRPMWKLQAALRKGFLSETDTVAIPAKGEIVIVAMMTLTDDDILGNCKLRSFERSLFIRMVEYDRGWLQTEATNGDLKMSIEELTEMAKCRTPREVTLTVRACKSAMSIEPLSQLNFGMVRSGDQKDKAFTIVNLSEAPLLFEIEKLESDEQNELRLNVGGGIRGVVPPYFTKVVPFIFAPVTEGVLIQRVVINNRMDPSASCLLIIKAVVNL